MPLEHLWATWRAANVRGDAASRSELPWDDSGDDRSLFERILQSGAPDDQTLIVRRGELCFVLMNRFPYTSGHLMDDGMIDPRDTRTTLGFLLETVWETRHRKVRENSFGIARM